jgi:hypothetical protein
MIARLRRSRTLLVSLGIALVFVPTAFGVFAEWTQWPTGWRVLILVLWLLVAAFVIWGGVAHEASVRQLVGHVKRRRDETRRLAADRAFAALLQSGTGLPNHYLFRVYIYDPDIDRLVATYDPDGKASSATQWEPGQGATGVAWEREEFVLATGERAFDDTYGLTPEQQRRFKDLEVVAAMPVRNERDEVIAVLTGSSKTDDGVLISDQGFEQLQELALIVGRLLVDLLGEED